MQQIVFKKSFLSSFDTALLEKSYKVEGEREELSQIISGNAVLSHNMQSSVLNEGLAKVLT